MADLISLNVVRDIWGHSALNYIFPKWRRKICWELISLKEWVERTAVSWGQKPLLDLTFYAVWSGINHDYVKNTQSPFPLSSVYLVETWDKTKGFTRRKPVGDNLLLHNNVTRKDKVHTNKDANIGNVRRVLLCFT